MFLIVGVSALAAVSVATQKREYQTTGDCRPKIEEKIVTGNSLCGIVEAGDRIRVAMRVDQCNPIVRGDIVLYRFYGNENPVIKVVRGVPGDTLSLEESDGGFHIVVNGEILENSFREPFLNGEAERRLLGLYISDYGSRIPGGAYLLLGNRPEGTMDSTRFGLVSGQDILGKVIDYE